MLSTDPITKNRSFQAKEIYHACVKNIMLDDGFYNLCISGMEHDFVYSFVNHLLSLRK